MTFWDFVSNNALAVMVLLWFLWCVFDRACGMLEARNNSVERRVQRMASRMENALRERPVWVVRDTELTVKTKTETPAEPTQKIEEKR